MGPSGGDPAGVAGPRSRRDRGDPRWTSGEDLPGEIAFTDRLATGETSQEIGRGETIMELRHTFRIERLECATINALRAKAYSNRSSSSPRVSP
jgi:hypothetical protein